MQINLNMAHVNLKNLLVKLFVFLLILLWCLGFSLPVVFHNADFTALSYPFLNSIYEKVCHQKLEKTIFVNSSHLLVCSRCAGIYIGALFISFINIFLTKKFNLNNKYLFLSALPMITDIILYTTGVYSYTKSIAFITGWLLGSVGFLYIFDSFENFLLMKLWK